MRRDRLVLPEEWRECHTALVAGAACRLYREGHNREWATIAARQAVWQGAKSEAQVTNSARNRVRYWRDNPNTAPAPDRHDLKLFRVVEEAIREWERGEERRAAQALRERCARLILKHADPHKFMRVAGDEDQ